MIEDREISLAPVMSALPAVVTKPDGAINMLQGVGGVALGSGHVDGFGPALFVALFHPVHGDLVGAIPTEGVKSFMVALENAIREIASGKHDRPQVAN